MTVCYFAHPITDYGTPRQSDALSAIKANGWTVENPDAPEHAEAYKSHGMHYFIELVGKCDCLCFMRFPDGEIGAGVAKEITAAFDAGKLVFEFIASHVPLQAVHAMPTALSVEDTRALIARLRAA